MLEFRNAGGDDPRSLLGAVDALLAEDAAKPPLLYIPLIMLFGGYLIWSVYLVFPPMWRKVWGEERSKIGCNPATLLMAFAAFMAVFAISFLIGPFGGGIWSYAKLRKAAALGDHHKSRSSAGEAP
jgi:hypothetical protein